MQTKLVVNPPGDRFEREADHIAARVMQDSAGEVRRYSPVTVQHFAGSERGAGAPAPPTVERALRGSGQPLDPETRSFFERRFCHDFGRVRVHDDTVAEHSARAVSAHAYTVGEHIVFAAGRYAPNTAAGRGLLAHELTHVMQQRAVVQRHSISPEPRIERNGEEEEEEDRARVFAEERESAGGHSGLALPGLRLQRQLHDEPWSSGWPEKDEAARIRAEMAAERECVERTGPDPLECDPNRVLTWSDFTASAPARSRFGAMTFSELRERPINVALLRCMPQSAAAAGASNRGTQAFFDPARSWVKPEFAGAGDPARNGCARTVASCEAHFDREAAAGRTGGTFSMSSVASTACPASVTARGDTARSRGECASLVGTDCGDRAAAESARLLRHEQGHFDLTCAMARKANAMLSSTTDFDGLLRGARTALRTAQNDYDTQTDHGCVGSQQSAWEADIAAGLPSVTITVQAARQRRGR